MMPSVTTALRSQRVIATLAEHDPQFRALITELYGPQADATAVWLDTFGKMDPDPSSVHSPGSGSSGRQAQRWALRLAAAGTAAGAVSASRDVVEGVRGVRDVTRIKPPGSLWPKKAAAALAAHPRRLAGARIANGALALGADAVAGTVVHRQQKAINKGLLTPSVEQMARGALVQSRRVSRHLLKTGGAKVAGEAKSAGKHAATKPGAGQLSMFDAAGAPARTPTTAGNLRAQQAGQKVAAAGSAVAGNPRTAAGVGVGLVGAGAVASSRSKEHGYYQQPAYYSKRDVEWEGTFSKIDDDKRLAFGWANVCKVDGALVTDRQGDVIVPEDLEDVAYDYVLRSRTGGDMHLRTDGTDVYPQEQARPGDKPVPVAEIVESMMFTAEKKQALGLSEDFPEGWWIGMKYHDDTAWDDIKAKRRTGFSIHGSGMRVPIEDAA